MRSFYILAAISFLALISYTLDYQYILISINLNENRKNKASGNKSIFSSNEAVQADNTDAEEEFQQCYGPLDNRELAANFARLKAAVSREVDFFLRQAGQPPTEALMRRRTAPIVDCRGWRLHSPSGRRNYTRSQLLAIAEAGDNEPGEEEDREDGSLIVPNVAHFVLPFADARLQFHHLVCILSCAWLMRPRLLYLWYDPKRPPNGVYWQHLQANLTAVGWWESRVVLAAREPPRSVYGNPLTLAEHQSDLMRLEAVLAFGGAYMDLDVLTLKSLRPLRRFPFVIGRQSAMGVCNGAFLASPGNQLLAMWHLAYQTFRDGGRFTL